MYIYKYIYTSVNPCISMHGAKTNRVRQKRVRTNMDLELSSSNFERNIRTQLSSAATAVKHAREASEADAKEVRAAISSTPTAMQGIQTMQAM